MSQLQVISSTTPTRTFEDHEGTVYAVAVFPDMRRMVTGSEDKILRLWDLETGVVLRKMEGHSSYVRTLAVSPDGQIIASGYDGGEIIVWHSETGEPLTQPIKAHSDRIYSVDFSPDGTVLATGSRDGMTKFWCTKTWQMQGEPIKGGGVNCVRYSPSGEKFLPLQHPRISKFVIQAQGNASHLSRVTLNGTGHSRGRRMAQGMLNSKMSSSLLRYSQGQRPTFGWETGLYLAFFRHRN